MTRALVVLAVLLVVVLAGCGSLGGTGTTRQPFGVDDTTETTTPGDANGSDPPSVIAFDPTADTTPGAFALVDAHYTNLAGRTYTVEYSTVVRYENGTTLIADDATRTMGPNRSTFVQDRSSRYGNDSVARDLYANGTHVWERISHDDDDAAIVRVLRDRNGDLVAPQDAISRLAQSELRSGLVAMNVTDVTRLDTVPSGVNVPVFEVTATRTATPDPFGDRTLNATMTLIVTEEGRIIEYLLERTSVVDGRRVHELTRIQFRNVGRASVTRPAWVHQPGGSNATDSTVQPT